MGFLLRPSLSWTILTWIGFVNGIHIILYSKPLPENLSKLIFFFEGESCFSIHLKHGSLFFGASTRNPGWFRFCSFKQNKNKKTPLIIKKKILECKKIVLYHEKICFSLNNPILTHDPPVKHSGISQRVPNRFTLEFLQSLKRTPLGISTKKNASRISSKGIKNPSEAPPIHATLHEFSKIRLTISPRTLTEIFQKISPEFLQRIPPKLFSELPHGFIHKKNPRIHSRSAPRFPSECSSMLPETFFLNPSRAPITQWIFFAYFYQWFF